MFQATNLQRNLVRIMATNGEPLERIAELLDINLPTLRKHCSAELRSGALQSNPSMDMRLFERALAGDVSAMLTWLKCKAGWNEHSAVTATGDEPSPPWLPIRHFTQHGSPEHSGPSQQSALSTSGSGARPRFKLSTEQRMAVRALAARGAGPEHIAKKIGIRQLTLRAQFAMELNIGRTQANAAVVQRLYQKCLQGNVSAMIFWLKCRAGWNENLNLAA